MAIEEDTFSDEADDDNEEPTTTSRACPSCRERRVRQRRRWAPSRGRPDVGGGGAGAGKESERKKRELITMGKAKGFLTYDEVNEHMPESIVSSDQMDDWLSAFGGEGIEIVDAATQGQGRPRRRPPPRPTRTRKQKPNRGRGRRRRRRRRTTTAYSKTNDPVRMYLRKMGSVVAAHARGRGRDRQAHRGRRAPGPAGGARIRRWPSRRSSSWATSCASRRSASRRSSRTRTRRTTSSTRQWHIERVCKVIDKVRKLYKDPEQLVREARRQGVPPRRSKQEAARSRSTQSSRRSSRRCGAAPQQEADRPDRAAAQGVRRAHRGGEPRDCRLERKSGLSLTRVQEDAARGPRLDRCASARSPRSWASAPEELEEMSEVIADARRRRSRRSRRRPSLDESSPARDRARDSRTASARPSRPRPSWSRPTCAWWSRSPRSTPTAVCSSWT